MTSQPASNDRRRRPFLKRSRSTTWCTPFRWRLSWHRKIKYHQQSYRDYLETNVSVHYHEEQSVSHRDSRGKHGKSKVSILDCWGCRKKLLLWKNSRSSKSKLQKPESAGVWSANPSMMTWRKSRRASQTAGTWVRFVTQIKTICGHSIRWLRMSIKD